MSTILDNIRQCIRDSDKSRYVLAKECGVSESQLSQLMAGTKGLSYDALERLVEALGMEIIIRPRTRRSSKKRSK